MTVKSKIVGHEYTFQYRRVNDSKLNLPGMKHEDCDIISTRITARNRKEAEKKLEKYQQFNKRIRIIKVIDVPITKEVSND